MMSLTCKWLLIHVFSLCIVCGANAQILVRQRNSAYEGWQTAFALARETLAKIWTIQHQNHPQDLPLHDKFYSTWSQPNNGNRRRVSCCNNQDCYPTNIVLKEGKWWAQRREDLKWMMVPDGKLEHNQPDPRESPDHQSHACISPPIGGDYVFCAVLGSGL
jgi:hypothetical protein